MKDPRPRARRIAAPLSSAAGVFCLAAIAVVHAQSPPTDPAARELGREVAGCGWILFSAKTASGDYDLFLSRPDGSAKRHVTQTPDQDEYGGRFAPDSRRILYRRQQRSVARRNGEGLNHDLWGAMGELVIAYADGSAPQSQGADGAWPWASWSPDGKQVACLYKREGRIRIYDLATKTLVRELPRQGIFQQMYWSPDGRRLCGTANLRGQDWNIISVDLTTGQSTLLTRALNCTPDWFQGDSTRVVYSHRTPGLGSEYGWTMLMQATADGKSRTLIYGERGRHIYYGCTSPDGRYVIFSLPESDGGTDAHMAIVRLADTPIVVPEDYAPLRSLYPGAKSGPVLRMAHRGFEPHWTYADLGGDRR